MGGENNFWDEIVPWVDPQRCRRCADCPPLAACLAGGFRRDTPEDLPYADEDFCFGCFSCVGACPHGAIMLPRRQAG